jgi:alpha-1,2-mannosyltransferase
MGLLNEKRVHLYPRLFFIIYLAIYSYTIFAGSGLLDANGKPIGSDFVQFWAASKMALSGEASEIYNHTRVFLVEEAVTGKFYPLPFHYPPIMLLMILPLALLPYLVSLAAWLGVTFVSYLSILRRVVPHPVAKWLILAFPGVFQNFIHGQNGFLSGVFLGGGLILVDRSPLWAGILLGLLSYKPQFLPMIPIALLFGRRWKALAGMAFSSGTLIVISLLAFGPEPWIAFWKNIPVAVKMVETGATPLHQLQTVFGAAILAGLDLPIARILHSTVAVIAAGVMSRLWLKNAPFFLRASSLALGILLLPPHVNSYDMTILALPLAWVGWEGYTRGWLSWEINILALCWIMPLISVGIAAKMRIQIAPLALMVLMVLVIRRSYAREPRIGNTRRFPEGTCP